MAVIAQQSYKIDLTPQGGYVVVYVSQHDNEAREIVFKIHNQGKVFDIPANINVSVQGVKSNGGYFTHNCTYSGNIVTMPIADDMTDVIGKAVCVLKFTNASEEKLATAKFVLNVDSDSSSEGIIIDTVAEEIFGQLLDEIRAQAAVFNVNIATLQSMVGTPLVATTAAGMTDHNKIYVYTGNETGYTYGNWYYWDDTEWQSGGQYNSVPIVIDQTPTSGSINTVSSNGVYSALNTKVDKVSGKGLSTEDYTTEEKTKLAGLTQIEEEIQALKDALYYSLDMSQATTINGRPVPEGASWLINNVREQSKEFPTQGWGMISVTASSRASLIALVTQSVSGLANGDAVPLCANTDIIRINANETKVITIPQDCAYLVIATKVSNVGGYAPSDVTVILSDSLTAKVYKLGPDTTLTKQGEAADSKTVGEAIEKINAVVFSVISGDLLQDTIWSLGNFNASTGAKTTSTQHVVSNFIPGFVKRIAVNNDSYVFAVYAYTTDGEYVGLYDSTSGTFKKSGWTNSQITEYDIPQQNSYKYKIRVSFTDGNAAPTDCNKLNFTIIAGSQSTTEINPCDYNGNSELSTFSKILCIGDSLIEGGANAPNITPDPANNKRTVARGTYSIPAFISKMYGVETTNWGISGATSKSWYNSKIASVPDWSGYDGALIYIGSNDYTYCTVGGMTADEGASESETYINNIIIKLKTDNPGIRIFLCTLNPNTTTGTLAQYRVPLMEKIRGIAENDNDVFLIDLNAYSSFKSGSAYSNGHPTAIGYLWMAREIANFVNYYMATAPDDFKWIRWIGTNYAVIETAPDQDDDGGYEGDVL